MHVNIEYRIGNRLVETIYNKPIGYAKFLCKKLKNTTHTLGTFIVVPN